MALPQQNKDADNPTFLDMLRRFIWPVCATGVTPPKTLTYFLVILTSVLLTGIHLGLDYFDIIAFHRPQALCLFLTLIWFWWLYRHRRNLKGARERMILVTRILLLSVFIWLLAEPQTLRKTDATTYIFAVDFSASIRPGSRLENQKYLLEKVINKGEDKGKKDHIGLITFARDSAVELPPSLSFPFENLEWTQQLDESATDIASALAMADAMMPESMNRRILLVTDGSQTQGDLDTVLKRLKAKGTHVDVLENAYDHEKEIVAEKLLLPQRIKRGESYYATVLVSSTHDTTATLTLSENGRPLHQSKVELKSGKNRFDLPVTGRSSGYYEYLATIEPDDSNPERQDGWLQNNRALASLHLEGPGKILLVTGPDEESDPRDWESIMKALNEAAADATADGTTYPEVVLAKPLGVPPDANALLPFDAVVFVNVARNNFTLKQMEAVKTAVTEQGAGFLMVGGEKSFGPGGYRQTPIEEILPVSLDVRQVKFLPKAALAIVLHTCEFPQGNTWAKLITKQAIKVLNSQDEAGVLAYTYDGSDKWLFPLMPVARFPQMAQAINNAQIGDMPAFEPTMKLALQGLSRSNAMVKHMIIISDGDPQPATKQTMQGFVNNRITISTIAVFPHGTSVGEMKRIAKTTGGRFYFPKNAKQLPGIFVKEARTLTKNLIVNVPNGFSPSIGFPSSLTKNVSAWPNLYGYVRTIPKGGTNQLVMSVPAAVAAAAEGEDPGAAQGMPDEPILAVGRAGTGVTAAFTSDLSANWAKDWVSWQRYSAFVRQLMSQVARRRVTNHLRMETYAADDAGVIVMEDFAPQDERQKNPIDAVAARVSTPTGDQTIMLSPTGPRRYEARFPLNGEGYYRVTGTVNTNQVGDDKTENQDVPNLVHGGFFVPYTREYASIRSSPIILKKIAETTGGRILSGQEDAETLYDFERTQIASTRPIFDWLLILLACLFPLDVACRRVQLDLVAMRRGFSAWIYSLFGGAPPVPAGGPAASKPAKPAQAGKATKQKKKEKEKRKQEKAAANLKKSKTPEPSKTPDLESFTMPPPVPAPPTTSKPASSKSEPAAGGEGGSLRDRLMAAKKRAQSQYGEDEKKD